jgi:hypothetical protein
MRGENLGQARVERIHARRRRARVQETAEGEQPFTLDGLMEVPQAVRVTDEKLPFVTADRAYGAPAPLR